MNYHVFRTIGMRFISALFLLSLLLGSVAKAGILLSEVMFDPDGSENTDEFIELYNDSAFPQQLQGWMITDGSGTDTLDDAGMGLLALPRQFVLILDPDYIADQSMTYDGLVPTSALVVTVSNGTFGSRGLSNSNSETISLLSSNGTVVSAYSYSIGNTPGHSDEKVRLAGGNSAENWADSEVRHGTPGFRNSVTPPEFDLGIARFVADPKHPNIGELFTLYSTVLNSGAHSAGNTIRLSVDSIGSGDYELLFESSIGIVSPADSLEFMWERRHGGRGIARYRVQLIDGDDDSTNNSASLLVSSSVAAEGLVINEIQFDPLPNRSEWVELTVAGTTPISLLDVTFSDGLGISDTSRRYRLPDQLLESGQFVVLAADSSVFSEQIPIEAVVHVFVSGAPTLNNNGDSLILWDVSGDILDRVDYRPNWGQGGNGVSLERLSLSSESNSPSNWGSSVDMTGSTPGRINSLALPRSRFETSLSISPSPFTPNGDGIDDVTEISYVLGTPGGTIDLFVFDLRGRQVRRLAGAQSGLTAGSVIWDGRDDKGFDLPTARYTVLLEAEVNGGMKREKSTVILARPQ